MNCADRSALSQILYVFGNWRPDSLAEEMKTIGRGTPCGCPSPPCGRPSWPILASEFRCDSPAPKPHPTLLSRTSVRQYQFYGRSVPECPFPIGVWHFLERVAKPRDLTADLPADWHSRSHFETPRHSYNSFRSWPLSPCACAGRSGRAAQRQPPVAPGSTSLFVRFRARLGSTIVRAPALRPCPNGCKTSTVKLEEPDFRLFTMPLSGHCGHFPNKM